ncbi:MAG: NfeD family protein [Verrucomicrobiota bacterium]
MEPWHYWIIAGCVLCILEIFTGDFLLLGLGIAAVGSGVAAFYDASLIWQVGVFAIISVIFVFGIRPVAKRHFYYTSDRRVSNVDAMSGKRGVIVASVPEGGQAGRVRVGAEEWRAVSEDGLSLREGEEIVVDAVEGATLHVRKPRNS